MSSPPWTMAELFEKAREAEERRVLAELDERYGDPFVDEAREAALRMYAQRFAAGNFELRAPADTISGQVTEFEQGAHAQALERWRQAHDDSVVVDLEEHRERYRAALDRYLERIAHGQPALCEGPHRPYERRAAQAAIWAVLAHAEHEVEQ